MKQTVILLCFWGWFPVLGFSKKTADSTINTTISLQNTIILQPYRLFGKFQEKAPFFTIDSDTLITLSQINSLTPVFYFFAHKEGLSTDTVTLQAGENKTLQFTGIKNGQLKYISAESIDSETADSLIQVLNEQNQNTANNAWYRRNEIIISLMLLLVAAFLIWKLYKRKKRNQDLSD